MLRVQDRSLPGVKRRFFLAVLCPGVTCHQKFQPVHFLHESIVSVLDSSRTYSVVGGFVPRQIRYEGVVGSRIM